jgi:anti-sigma28 factor (negative regulator of flagellin synthesis)
MKIDSPNPNAGQLSGVPAPQDRVELTKASLTQQTEKIAAAKGEGQESRAAAAGAATDSAQISGLSQLLRTQNDDTPERAAYLSRLEQQVALGEYNPNPADIARSIVDDLLKP